jgi:hypothetical protein
VPQLTIDEEPLSSVVLPRFIFPVNFFKKTLLTDVLVEVPEEEEKSYHLRERKETENQKKNHCMMIHGMFSPNSDPFGTKCLNHHPPSPTTAHAPLCL